MTEWNTLRLPRDVYLAAKTEAAKDRRSVASWVRLLIEDRLRQPQTDISYTFPRDWAGTEQWHGPQPTEVTNESYSWQQDQASVSQQEENRSKDDTE